MVEQLPEAFADDDHDSDNGDNGAASDGDDALAARVKRVRTTVTDGSGSHALRGLYLETINRARLDFDFEKLCSVSLSNHNVYACLVCGKYFQGRSKASHANIHSMSEDHHVFVYILPDGHEVMDASLNDIKHPRMLKLSLQFVIRPVFTESQVATLDSVAVQSYDLNNKAYLPGFVGLNNIKSNDFVNVIVQAFAHVRPLRNHFLLNADITGSELVDRFGLLVRKMWNPRAFKGQVSPHELIQEISNASKKRFRLGEQSDPIEFLSWFLNNLHMGLGAKKGGPPTIVQKTFQGELVIESQPTAAASGEDSMPVVNSENPQVTVTKTPFWFLTLDLPPPPLFTDEADKNIIPQVPLATLLSKYDGNTPHESGATIKRIRISKLPQYLIFCVKRFSKNNWNSLEKNPTIVNYPIKNLDMAEYVEGVDSARYDLVANICHEGKPGTGNGAYKIHVLSKAKDQWLQIQDLFVEEIMAQMIILSESYIQVWESVGSRA
nr:hypothetical protein HK105_003694 [Polyrhizophydium stewartii]